MGGDKRSGGGMESDKELGLKLVSDELVSSFGPRSIEIVKSGCSTYSCPLT